MGSKTNNVETHKINEVANMKRKSHFMLLCNLTTRPSFPVTQPAGPSPAGNEVTRRCYFHQ